MLGISMQILSPGKRSMQTPLNSQGLKNLLAVILILFYASLASAQPAPSSEPILAFNNARLILGNGEVIENGVLLTRGGVILDAASAASVEIPAGALIQDLSGKTVLPALVNTHAHLGWEAYGDWGSQYFTEANLVDHLYRHAYYGVGLSLIHI